MNERIEDLWWHARIGYNNQNCDPEVVEKFAELIVQECAGVVENAVNHREPASTYVGKIKQHFGVEE
jgi:hypothetical protein